MPKSKASQVRTVNIVYGFFFVINFILGTGFLGIPFSFYHAGLIAGVVTLGIISFVAWNTASWEVEVMARAQAVESYKMECLKKKTELEDSPSPSCGEPGSEWKQSINNDTKHPKYEILLTRKFEPTELCQVFFNRWVKYVYITVLSVYSFLSAWSFSCVAGTSWASNIPYNFSSVLKCSGEDFLHTNLPHGECLNAYRFSVFLFAVIVVPLSVLDLKELGFVQAILGILRFATVLAIVLYCIVNFFLGSSSSATGNNTNWTSLTNLTNSSSESYTQILFGFNINGWLVAIPIFVYAQILHQGIPALTHPIKEKKQLRWFMLVVFVTTNICYQVLGIVVALWFKEKVNETATLNWVPFTTSEHSLALRMLSYFIILFPSLDVTSAFPLVIHTIVNNLYLVLFGRDTSAKSKFRYEWVILLVLKLVLAVLPMVAALFLSNLVSVLKYAGLLGFFISFFFPTLLQLRSQWMCRQLFPAEEEEEGDEGEGEGEGEGKEGKWKGGGDREPNDVGYEGNAYAATEDERSKLLNSSGSVPKSSDNPLKKVVGFFRGSSYMTPYSNRVLSHPFAVVVLGLLGVALFILTLASLGVTPVK